jgi:photosystem II stability/assembly factor-like uncharacterized protein
MRILALYIFVAIVGALFPNSLLAQSPAWYAPNIFLPLDARYDDVFFISRDTGMLVSSHGLIYKTTNGGRGWDLKLNKYISLANYPYFRSIEFTADGQCGVAGTLNGSVYRTSDRGETWTDISTVIPDTGAFTKRMCGLAHWDNTFYGVGWWGGNVARLFKSTDAGITWTTSYIDPNLASGLIDITFLSANLGFASGSRLYNSGSKRESVVLKTTDGGLSWTKVFADTTIGGRIWKLQFVNGLVGVGSIEPIYADTVAIIKTIDGGDSWQIMPVGHRSSYAWGTQGVGFISEQKGWVGGYYHGMFETNDGGLTWDTLSIGADLNRFFKIDDIMYVSGQSVFKYSNAATDNGTPSQAKPLPAALTIFPNPSRGKVNIEFTTGAPMNIVLEVINLDTKTAYSVTAGYMKAGHYVYKWENPNAPPGHYIAWLGTDDIPVVGRFILVR